MWRWIVVVTDRVILSRDYLGTDVEVCCNNGQSMKISSPFSGWMDLHGEEKGRKGGMISMVLCSIVLYSLQEDGLCWSAGKEFSHWTRSLLLNLCLN